MTAPLPLTTVSLRKRLILIPAVVAVVASAVALAIIVHQARQRVVAERVSAADLAEQLIRQTIGSLPAGAGDPLGALAEVVNIVPGLRHVRLFILPRQQDAFDQFQRSKAGGDAAPRWFAGLLRPLPWSHRHEIRYEGRLVGYAVVVGDPDDEIAEIWHELLLIAGLLGALSALFVCLVWWSVNNALRPLGMLSAGLARLENGDFTASLPPLTIPELTVLGEMFNRLAQGLARISRDNRFLIGQLISLQENERKLLAHELHDELGPSLFGIKAQAACITRPGGGTGEERHARTILTLVDDLQKLNRRILGRLRPIALQDLGLPAAMAQLVEDWRGRQPEIDWQFVCSAVEPPPDEATALTLFRVAQECLTNAARHSGAKRVRVELESGPAERLAATDPAWPMAGNTSLVCLAVKDDGRGLHPDAGRGFGLLGIRERVAGHGGKVMIGGSMGAGLSIIALLPLTPVRQGDRP